MKGGGGYHSLPLASVGCGVSERGELGCFGAGDKAVQLSETPAILPIT
jgi:hypothetical protein